MLEYKWIRHYIALSSESQIEKDLIERTRIFNILGNEGWKLLSLPEEPHHFCFCREADKSCRRKYAYLWYRNYIPCHSENQIQSDLHNRECFFNDLAKKGYLLIHRELAMFCFVKQL